MNLKKKSLRLFTANAFGLLSKLDELRHVAGKLQPDIIVITETKLTPEKASQNDVHVPGYYEPLRKDRSGQGGGVGVWVKNTLVFKHIDQIDTSQQEVIWLAVTLAASEKVVICAAYRPGSCSDTDVQLLNHIDKSIETARRYGHKLILAGDFNVHNADWLCSTRTTVAGELAEDICHLHGLTQHVEEPTRGHNTLDLVMSDFDTVKVVTDQPLGRSDHSTVIADFFADPHHVPKTSRTVWRYTNADWARLNSFFMHTDWDLLFTGNADESCESLSSHIQLGMRKFIPSRRLTIRRTCAKWWTPECTDAVNSKKAAWKRLQKDPQNEILRQQHKQAIKFAEFRLQSAKASHVAAVRARLSSGSLSSKQWWSAVKQAAGSHRSTDIPLLCDSNGNEYVTSKEKAECFGRHFSLKCSVPLSCRPNDDLPGIRKRSDAVLSHVRFRPSLVKRELRKLAPHKATGSDEIPARVLNACADSLALPLSRLFTMAFRQGVQPAKWKLARVVPVYKRKSKSDPKNYRPISLLPIMSKVMEAIVNRQLMNFLERHSILSSNQFGFRRNIGSHDLLTKLQFEWNRSAGSGGCTRVLAVDIAGAFDRVWHKGLLHKAQCYGISGTLLRWLQSYLSGRQLTVVIDGQSSSPYPISAGVPQGSILGPSLFLLYINDAEDHLPPTTRLAAYADDTTLFQEISSANNLMQDSAVLQKAVSALSDWGSQWLITFEPSKSQCFSISHHQPPWYTPPITFQGHVVEEVPTIKLLGITFDQHLSFSHHLRQVAVRATQRLGLMKKACPILDSKGRSTLYKGFVRPVMEYAPLTWMGAPASYLAKLDAVQHRALSLIGCDTLLPSLIERRTVAALSYLYKLQSPSSPVSLQAMVPPYSDPQPALHATRLAGRRAQCHSYQLSSCISARSRNSLRQSFPHGVIHNWNNLPSSLLVDPPSDKGLQTFKVAVHRHLTRERWLWATDHI